MHKGRSSDILRGGVDDKPLLNPETSNPGGKPSNALYRSKPSWYYERVRADLLSLLPPQDSFSEALEVGCGTGETLGLLIRDGRVRRGSGVEPFRPAADHARTLLSEVFEEDVEEWSMRAASFIGGLDLVIAGDVLEHLRDPWSLLTRLRKLQAGGGLLLLSVPNVQHYSVSLPLLALGRWKYVEQGLLDRTHLRFFTLGGIKAMVHEAGYRIEVLRFNAGPLGRFVVASSAGLLRPLLAYQYLLRCRAV